MNVTFSIITPVWNTEPSMLRECIESVLHQTYPYWELCLVDDASTRAETRDVLNHYAAFDPRIRVAYREENGGISQASNDAIAMATGDYVALLDHDDMLNLEALSAVSHVLWMEPSLDIVYSDEDKFERIGRHFDPYYKPGFSPEMLLTQMYIGHLTVYRRNLLTRLGGFRLGFEGSQDWDLALRATEATRAIRHIPLTLYHWRSHAASTASSADAKPYAALAAERALREALDRRGIAGTPVYSPTTGYFQIRRTLDRLPSVSVIIPTAGGRRRVHGEDVRLIDQAITSLRDRTDYAGDLDVVVVFSAGVSESLEAELRELAGDLPISFLPSTGRFDFALAINRGALASDGDYLLLLNDDIDAITPDWLQLLVEALDDDEVGAAGPRLLFEDGSVQHAGVVHDNGMPVHLQRGQPDGPGYFGELVLTRTYFAVTGACLLTPRKVFTEVGGLSSIFPVNYNDIDYCMKLAQLGKRSVYVGAASLHHFESSSREPTVTVHEVADYSRYWADLVQEDPYAAPARLTQRR